MNLKKVTLGTFTIILSTGVLFGCGNADDQQEQDPAEQPTEEQDTNNGQEQAPTDEPAEEMNTKDEQEPDPTEEPTEE